MYQYESRIRTIQRHKEPSFRAKVIRIDWYVQDTTCIALLIDCYHSNRPLTLQSLHNHVQVTAITYKRDITLMDIHSTQMLGCYGFLAKVFGDFEKHKLSVDVLASSEVSVSLTLDKKQNQDDIKALVNDMSPYAEVTLHGDKSILTLIADVERSSQVLATVFRVFADQNISVLMMSQGASKVNISFIVPDDQLENAVLNLHRCFFEDNCAVDVFKKEEGSMQDSSNGKQQSNVTLVEA